VGTSSSSEALTVVSKVAGIGRDFFSGLLHEPSLESPCSFFLQPHSVEE